MLIIKVIKIILIIIVIMIITKIIKCRDKSRTLTTTNTEFPAESC